MFCSTAAPGSLPAGANPGDLLTFLILVHNVGLAGDTPMSPFDELVRTSHRQLQNILTNVRVQQAAAGRPTRSKRQIADDESLQAAEKTPSANALVFESSQERFGRLEPYM